jgi:hypothetical protein
MVQMLRMGGLMGPLRVLEGFRPVMAPVSSFSTPEEGMGLFLTQVSSSPQKYPTWTTTEIYVIHLLLAVGHGSTDPKSSSQELRRYGQCIIPFNRGKNFNLLFFINFNINVLG